MIALLVGLVHSWQSRQRLDYRDCLDETAFTVDGQAVKMKWLAFYVVFEEREVEKQAMVYHPDSTADYWNLHIDGHFIRQDAKDTMMQMAIHDYIYYQKAMEKGMTLDAKEQKMLENTISDFWMDLLEEQMDQLPVSDEYLIKTMQHIALAEKYQSIYAQIKNGSTEDYSVSGEAYQKMLEGHEVIVNEDVWDRVDFGHITVHHKAS